MLAEAPQTKQSSVISPEHLKYLEELLQKEPSFLDSNVNHSASNPDFTIEGLPLEYVEFELKNAKEYMAKLKFNLLELTSKRVFLDKLMPTGTIAASEIFSSQQQQQQSSQDSTLSLYDEWTNCQTRWTPGDLKELERIVESRKADLKQVKESVATVKEEIANITSHVVTLKQGLDSDRDAVSAKINTICRLEAEINVLQSRLTDLVARSRLPAGMSRCGSCEESGSAVAEMLGLRAPEELKAELAQLAAARESKSASIATHRTQIADLHRLLQHHTDDLSRLAAEESALSASLAAKQEEKASNAEAALEQLCVWHRSALEAVAEVTRMQFEMIRPDYILVTFKGLESVIPVHLTVDPQTGRLLNASVGTTSATPKHGWKELCQQAVDSNDICHLLHSVQQRL